MIVDCKSDSVGLRGSWSGSGKEALCFAMGQESILYVYVLARVFTFNQLLSQSSTEILVVFPYHVKGMISKGSTTKSAHPWPWQDVLRITAARDGVECPKVRGASNLVAVVIISAH